MSVGHFDGKGGLVKCLKFALRCRSSDCEEWEGEDATGRSINKGDKMRGITVRAQLARDRHGLS